jgi:hypothetical protein
MKTIIIALALFFAASAQAQIIKPLQTQIDELRKELGAQRDKIIALQELVDSIMMGAADAEKYEREEADLDIKIKRQLLEQIMILQWQVTSLQFQISAIERPVPLKPDNK